MCTGIMFLLFLVAIVMFWSERRRPIFLTLIACFVMELAATIFTVTQQIPVNRAIRALDPAHLGDTAGRGAVAGGAAALPPAEPAVHVGVCVAAVCDRDVCGGEVAGWGALYGGAALKAGELGFEFQTQPRSAWKRAESLISSSRT